MVAQVVDASVLSYALGFSLQLLTLVIVLPYVLLSGPLSLKSYVIIFSLARTLSDVFFFLSTRGILHGSEGYVAVTRIQVHIHIYR